MDEVFNLAPRYLLAVDPSQHIGELLRNRLDGLRRRAGLLSGAGSSRRRRRRRGLVLGAF
jgi:hypothetical protein